MKSSQYFPRLTLLLAILAALSRVWSLPVLAEEPAPGVRIERNVPVPMRDGIILRANVFRPALDPGPHPVLVLRTPYGKDAQKP